MQTIVERPSALDVRKAQVTACARVPGEGGRREQHIAEFAARRLVQPVDLAGALLDLRLAIEDAGIKLDTGAADVMGKSGRDMLDALVAGETDPEVLAELARRRDCPGNCV